MKATQTEYRKVVYRSKSEAMFARYLELKNNQHYDSRLNCGDKNSAAGFIYEPVFLELLSGWKPDFYWWSMIGDKFNCLQIQVVVIEYKPAVPTNTYLRGLCEKWQSIVDILNVPPSFVLYYGDFYAGKDCGKFRFLDCETGWKIEELKEDWLSEFRSEILATRFDLEAV